MHADYHWSNRVDASSYNSSGYRFATIDPIGNERDINKYVSLALAPAAIAFSLLVCSFRGGNRRTSPRSRVRKNSRDISRIWPLFASVLNGARSRCAYADAYTQENEKGCVRRRSWVKYYFKIFSTPRRNLAFFRTSKSRSSPLYSFIYLFFFAEQLRSIQFERKRSI